MEHSPPWFDALYKRHAPNMIKVATGLLDNQAIAEEIVQDVFLILLIRQDQLNKESHLSAWLYRALRNRIGNELQRASNKREVPFTPENEQAAAVNFSLGHLEELLPLDLNGDERQLLIWHYAYGLTLPEISLRLGCSVHACQMRLYRAREKCKKLLLKRNFIKNL